MKRLLNLTAVSGSLCLISLLGCQNQNQQLGRNPGALPRHNPPANAKINATTLFAHAHLLERQGAFERAVIQYEKAIAEKPDFLTARNRLGITLNKLGRHMEASSQFEICLETQPSVAYLHNNLGFSRYLEGQFELAETHLRQAIQLDPEFARARMNHAVVLSKLGRQQDAYNELAQIGSKADACFNMGILLTEAGQFDSAAQYLEAALAANPKFEAARKQLHEVARLAAEHEARVATDVYAQQTLEPGPQVASSNPPAPVNNPTPAGNSNNATIEEVALTPAPQPTSNQPVVASNQPNTSSNVYGNNAPQQPSSFQNDNGSSNQVVSSNNNNNSGSNSSVTIESAPSQPVESSTSTPQPVVASNTNVEEPLVVREGNTEPVQDPMSVYDTAGRGSNAPQPRPEGEIETIYVGSTPVANSTPNPTPAPQPQPVATATPTNPTPQGTNSSAVTIEPVHGGSSSNTAPVSTPSTSTVTSSSFEADPQANVEDDPACSEENDYTVIETIDINAQGNDSPQPVQPVQPVADVTPIADARPASSSVIVEPVD